MASSQVTSMQAMRWCQSPMTINERQRVWPIRMVPAQLHLSRVCATRNYPLTTIKTTH